MKRLALSQTRDILAAFGCTLKRYKVTQLAGTEHEYTHWQYALYDGDELLQVLSVAALNELRTDKRQVIHAGEHISYWYVCDEIERFVRIAREIRTVKVGDHEHG